MCQWEQNGEKTKENESLYASIEITLKLGLCGGEHLCTTSLPPNGEKQISESGIKNTLQFLEALLYRFIAM